MADETRHVWFVVLDGQDVHTNHVGTGSVEVPLSCNVAQFKKAVVAMYVRLLKDVELDQLRVYPSMDEFLNHDCALIDDQSIAEFGSAPAESIIVLAPDLQRLLNEDFPSKKRQRCDDSANPKLSNLLVDPAEFNLANLSAIQGSETPILSTLGLQAFCQGYGGFPSSYMVRKEESMVWRVIENFLDDRNPTRVVLVGSSGVGKSCLVMLVGMYMAFFKQNQVVIVRKLMMPGLCNALMYLDGRSKRVWKEVNVLEEAMAELINGRFRDSLLFVDGYSQAELAESHHQALRPFHFLAMSSYYDVKPSEFAEMVVLPSWRRCDLLTYVRLTNWADNAGFSAVTLTEPNLKEFVNQHYYYSGGSLHQFCKPRPQLIRRVGFDLQVVGKVGEAIGRSPFYCYEDSRKNENLDRVCRHFVADPSDPLHYTTSSQWKFCIDSGYALAKLGDEMTSKELFQVYQYGKSIDTGFQAAAFKLFFHRAVCEAIYRRGPEAKIKMRANSPYPIIQLIPGCVNCQGQNESECLNYLAQTLDVNTYWHLKSTTFPFVDAVAMFQPYLAQPRREGIRVQMGVISVITEDAEEMQREHLDKLKQALALNAKLTKYKPVFLVVRPKPVVTEHGNWSPLESPFGAVEGSLE
ncbi:hypothetical protein Ae201684_007844 [Aphanomyces euteiches]|uniref:Crinkler (CRN) family protein n=1 Tax=Aphanomyces euteiches TaxID=100861 RepID=A0A6G0X7A4_9STRA|nr:hypothetical protein Ae201684_007844 [Aphanomyces euteiches]